MMRTSNVRRSLAVIRCRLNLIVIQTGNANISTTGRERVKSSRVEIELCHRMEACSLSFGEGYCLVGPVQIAVVEFMPELLGHPKASRWLQCFLQLSAGAAD